MISWRYVLGHNIRKQGIPNRKLVVNIRKSIEYRPRNRIKIIYKILTAEILEASVHQLFVMIFAVFTSAKFVRKADRIMVTQSIDAN